jgi:hypothetical protein
LLDQRLAATADLGAKEGELAQARGLRAMLAERALAAEIASGAPQGVDEWRRWHEEGFHAPALKLLEPG